MTPSQKFMVRERSSTVLIVPVFSLCTYSMLDASCAVSITYVSFLGGFTTEKVAESVCSLNKVCIPCLSIEIECACIM